VDSFTLLFANDDDDNDNDKYKVYGFQCERLKELASMNKNAKS
jgi:hypothetical protein